MRSELMLLGTSCIILALMVATLKKDPLVAVLAILAGIICFSAVHIADTIKKIGK